MRRKKIKVPIFLILLLFVVPLCGQEITFATDIAPIIFQKCAPCHHPGQIGPMPLTTYENVASYATMIAYVTKVGYMPPWRATSTAHALKGENKLSAKELELIQQWISEGFVEGDAEATPPLPYFQDAEEMETPDLVLSMSTAFEQYGVYYDQYRVFVLPTGLKEDQMVSAIEFVPGHPGIVRSAMLSIDTGEQVEALDKWDPQYGYFSFGEVGFIPDESRWYNWQPGKGRTVFEEGQGLFLPKDSKVLLHIHYGPTGVPQNDSSHINLQFYGEKKVQRLFTAPLLHPYNMTNDSFYIPQGKVTRYHASFRAPFDLAIHGIFPHSHLLGKQWEVFSVGADRKNTQSLLKIEDWDFNWKQTYEFESPVVIREGTEIHALAAYDNSKENLLNPSDPPRDMDWGKRMFEEMFLVYFSMNMHPSENNSPGTFSILPGPVIASPAKVFNFQFQTNKKGTFTAQIKDFSGEVQQILFKDQTFSKGEFTRSVDLQKLAFGNYYIELQSKDKVDRKLFVLFAEDLFD